MTVKDDYPLLQSQAVYGGRAPNSLPGEALRALDELSQLRRWKAEAECVIEEWDQLWEEAGCPGQLGQTKAAGLLAALKSDGII